MLPPEEDLQDRQTLWDEMQMVWMDTDIDEFFPRIVAVCAASKYSLSELEQIFWNEVEPAVGVNLWDIAGEWRGFIREELAKLILQKHRFGAGKPLTFLRPYADRIWGRLAAEIINQRKA